MFLFISGFDGCLSKFLINGNPLPMNGSSEKYDIELDGEIGSSCTALCDGDPCGGENNCSVEGEEYKCLLVAQSSSGLESGIIVIIVFFIILLLAIIILFVLFNTRRDLFNRCVKPKKQNAGHGVSGVNGKAMTNSDSMIAPGVGSRYAHNPSEEEIIRGHILEELAGQKSNSLSTRPDLIGHSYSPQMLTDGVMIMDPDDMQVVMDEENVPEHYDFENASSIAPSDIAPSEVIRHYRDFRNGNPHHHHHHHNHKNPPHSSHLFNKFRDSPVGLAPNMHRDSPTLVPNHTIQQPRQSPISLSGSAMSVPAHSSPSAVLAINGGRPSSALASLNQPQRSRMSPLTQLHVRSPRTHPHNHNNNYNYNSSTAYGTNNNARDSCSNSIGSHHSHSSSSSATAVPNGYPANKQNNQKYSGNKPGGRTRAPKGLTVEDVNRLNARPDMLLHGTSSSPEGRRRADRATGIHLSQPHHHIGLEGSLLLEPPDSSSEDSGANDSFTCSEFEYDNETARGRLDLDPSKMIFSKLTEVDNECDDHPVNVTTLHHQSPNPLVSGNADGLNSNGDSFASTNASSSNSQSPSSPVLHPISSQYDFDALLNWGPNFDKLVGVFSDIAQLPDSNRPAGTGGSGEHDYEEYV